MRSKWDLPATLGFLIMESIAAIALWCHAWIFACVFGVLAMAAGIKAASGNTPALRVTGVVCAIIAAILMVIVLAGRIV